MPKPYPQEFRDDVVRVARNREDGVNHPTRKLTREEIGRLTNLLGGMTAVLRRAEPAKKLELYRKFGLKLAYDHTVRTVVAGAAPPPPVGVLVVSGGGYLR
ncbi:hypothetical protein ACFWPH_32760 [Nocardia sp. NPDC058499]|uniref:hypothetical protein n=1 Tax=Nocardia sp. NPDC058499 TaxID=3346530 RepID=UPI0036599AA9